MKIDVYSDMVCPWCRIGKKNMSDAIGTWSQATGEMIPVTYHAYQLDPSLPPEGMPFNDAMEKKMGGPQRLRPMLERVTAAGAAVGVTFHFDQVARMPNTLLAHRITALLQEDLQEQWVDSVMKAYFEDALDIAKLDVLLGLAREMGVDPEILKSYLDDGEGLEEVQKDRASVQGMGISGVPLFIINGQYVLSGAYPSAQFIEAFRKISKES